MSGEDEARARAPSSPQDGGGGGGGGGWDPDKGFRNLVANGVFFLTLFIVTSFGDGGGFG